MKRAQAQQVAAELSKDDNEAFVIFEPWEDDWYAISLPILCDSPEIKIEQIAEVWQNGERDTYYY